MGITFRSGGYIKHVRFGGRTIKDGEAAAIWNRNGMIGLYSLDTNTQFVLLSILRHGTRTLWNIHLHDKYSNITF